MAEDTTINEDIDKIEKEIEEFANSLGNSGDGHGNDGNQDGDGSGNDRDQNNNDNENGQGNEDNQSEEETAELDDEETIDVQHKSLSSPEKKSEKGSSKGSSGPKEKKKHKIKEAKGDNFMQVVWNEIENLFGDILDGITDWILNFLDFILFSQKKIEEEEKEEKNKRFKNIFEHGDRIAVRQFKNAESFNKAFKAAHAEIISNIEKKKAGQNLEWKIWGSEPRIFTRAVQIEQAARRDPNSREAVIWNDFVNAPNRVEKMFNNELLKRRLSVSIATLDEAASTEAYKMPSKAYGTVFQIESIVKKEPMDKEKLQEKLEELSHVDFKNSDVTVQVTAQIRNMMQLLGREPLMKREDFKKGLIEGIIEIRNASPHSEIIERNSVIYYNEIGENLNKIKELYADDPQTRNAITKEYIQYIKSKIKVAKEKANSRVIKGKQAKGASKAVRKAREAINDFKVNGVELSAIPTSTRRAASPFSGNRQNILQAVSGSLGR